MQITPVIAASFNAWYKAQINYCPSGKLRIVYAGDTWNNIQQLFNYFCLLCNNAGLNPKEVYNQLK